MSSEGEQNRWQHGTTCFGTIFILFSKRSVINAHFDKRVAGPFCFNTLADDGIMFPPTTTVETTGTDAAAAASDV